MPTANAGAQSKMVVEQAGDPAARAIPLTPQPMHTLNLIMRDYQILQSLHATCDCYLGLHSSMS